MPPRIPPVEPPYSEPVTTAFARVTIPDRDPLVLFRTLAVNERVLKRVLGGGLLDKGELTIRERELVIDRTTWRHGAENEYGVHVALFAAPAGLTETELHALCSEDISVFSAREQLLLGLVDQLVATTNVSDKLWTQLAAEFTPAQLVELVAVTGYYTTISMFVNAFRLPLEPFGARFG